MKKQSNKPWSGRFREELSASAEKFTASIHFDARLYKQDIVQSIAYARALTRAKVLTSQEAKKIIRALEEIMRQVSHHKLDFKPELEDLHMNLEAMLIEKVGEVGKKLHAGRSRNDQVATDLRMYIKYEETEIVLLIKKLQSALVDLAEKNLKVIMPGYTHLQRAQPILLSHYFMAYYEMLERDRQRFIQAGEEADCMPLGSGALAGNSFDIDREALAKELGFSRVSHNSLDAVSDRDFVIGFLSACAMLIMHISRLSEELIIWSTYEFNFIELSDRYTTGSSIMPQKKNPDIAELCRGKCGRVYGHLMAVLTVMKGLPLAYNRDMQEDKEAVFGAVDTIKDVLTIFSEMLASIKINNEVMSAAAKKGFLTATDLAFYLVRKDVPFRQAHEIVGKIVAYCEESNMQLEYLSLTQLKQFSDKFAYDAPRVLSTESSIASRSRTGGTSLVRVKEEIKRARKNLLHGEA